jgi:hypothetical protein
LKHQENVAGNQTLLDNLAQTCACDHFWSIPLLFASAKLGFVAQINIPSIAPAQLFIFGVLDFLNPAAILL